MPLSELLDEMKTQELEILVEQLLADLGMGEPSFKFDAVSAWADGQYWIDFTDRRQLIGSQFKRIVLITPSPATAPDTLRKALLRLRDEDLSN